MFRVDASSALRLEVFATFFSSADINKYNTPTIHIKSNDKKMELPKAKLLSKEAGSIADHNTIIASATKLTEQTVATVKILRACRLAKSLVRLRVSNPP